MENQKEAILKFGRYQKLMAALIGIISLIDSMPIFSTVFTAANPDLTCYTKSSTDSTQEWTKLENKCTGWNQLGAAGGSNGSVYKCEFDKRYYGESIITEWGLVCDRQYLASLTQTFYLAGTFSAFFVGYLSDTYGRRTVGLAVFFVFCLAQIVSQFFQFTFFHFSWVTHYTIYSICQFIIGFTANSLFNITYTLLFELVASQYAQLVSNINLCLYVSGELVVNIVAFVSRDWRVINWFVAAFSTVVFLVCLFVMPESPQYMIERGREKDLAKFIRTVAKVNRVRVEPSDQFKYADLNTEAKDSHEKAENQTTLSLLKITFNSKKNIIKTLFLAIIWFGVSMIYYGVSLGITSVSQNVNPYLIFGLSSISEFIGYLLCSINVRVGHKRVFAAYMALASTTCLGVSLLQLMHDTSDAKPVLLIVFACIGKAMTSAAFNSAYVYTSEMYETRVRNTLLLLLACFGRIGSVISPQINLLGDLVLKQLPYLVFSFFSFIGCVLIIILPNPFAATSNKI